MKITFDTNGVLIVTSHVSNDPVVEVGRYPAGGDIIAFEGPRTRQIQLFEAVLNLLKSSDCLFLIGDKTVASNSPDLAETAKEIR